MGIIVALLLFIILFCYGSYRLVNGQEAYDVLLGDDLLWRLNDINLRARGVETIGDYKNVILKSVVEPGLIFRIYLFIWINYINMIKIKSWWIDNEKFHSLPWKIIVIGGGWNGVIYENGLPHTRGDYIIVNTDMSWGDGIRTLLHEKMHVYQKMHKKEVDSKVLKKFKIIGKMEERGRVNPDTDGVIYKDGNGDVYKCNYIGDNPANLSDVVFGLGVRDPKFEHPYERIVYDSVESVLFGLKKK